MHRSFVVFETQPMDPVLAVKKPKHHVFLVPPCAWDDHFSNQD